MSRRQIESRVHLWSGTSPRDGTALAAAVAEQLGAPRANVQGFFATHLHGMLPLVPDLRRVQMGVEYDATPPHATRPPQDCKGRQGKRSRQSYCAETP